MLNNKKYRKNIEKYRKNIKTISNSHFFNQIHFYFHFHSFTEAYDGFLIGLPSELRAESPQCQNCYQKVIKNADENVNNSSKRRRIDDQRVTTNGPANSSAFNPNQASTSLQKIGPEIRVKKFISRLNQSKLSQSTTVTAKSDFEMTGSDDVIFMPTDEMPKPKPLNDPKKRLEAARRATDHFMYLAENRMTSPKNSELRTTMKSPLVSVLKSQHSGLKMEMESSGSNNSKVMTKLEGATNSNNKIGANVVANVRLPVKNNEPKKMNAEDTPKMTFNVISKIVDIPKETPSNGTLPKAIGKIVTRSRASLENAHHPVKLLFKCKQCNYRSENKANVGRHMLSHVEKYKPMDWECKHCQKKFPQKPNLVMHLRQHHFELQSQPGYWEFKTVSKDN